MDTIDSYSELIILVHGLQGNVGHMEYLESCLKNLSPSFLVLNASSNDGGWMKNYFTTSDGIDSGATRIAKEISQFLEAVPPARLSKLSKISFIGSSLGGCYARYILSLLWNKAKHCFSIPVGSATVDLAPRLFVTLASPHLGTAGLMHHLMLVGSTFVFQGTGTQLALQDDQKLVFTMATSDLFLDPLKSFPNRISYASTPTDEWRVPYPSSAMCAYCAAEFPTHARQSLNPFIEGERFYAENEIPKSQHPTSKAYFEGSGFEDSLNAMIASLHSMTWHVVDVNLTHAQTAVINANRDPLAQHVLSHFKAL